MVIHWKIRSGNDNLSKLLNKWRNQREKLRIIKKKRSKLVLAADRMIWPSAEARAKSILPSSDGWLLLDTDWPAPRSMDSGIEGVRTDFELWLTKSAPILESYSTKHLLCYFYGVCWCQRGSENQKEKINIISRRERKREKERNRWLPNNKQKWLLWIGICK